MDTFRYEFNIGSFTCMAIRDGEDWLNVLFIDTGHHHVLIDTGYGDASSPPGLVAERLAASGISPTAIDLVLISHGDIDHIGGTMDATGRFLFPSARYILARDEWDFWSSTAKRTSERMVALLGQELTQ